MSGAAVAKEYQLFVKEVAGSVRLQQEIKELEAKLSRVEGRPLCLPSPGCGENAQGPLLQSYWRTCSADPQPGSPS